jgi:LysM repeat protein
VIPALAAPALVSVAAAICLSPQAAQAATTTPQITPQVSAQPAVVTDAASFPGAAFAGLPNAAELMAQTKAKASSGLLATYKVRSGDTLSKIAQRFYHDQAAWPAIYWANHGQIHYADVITEGQSLKIPVKPAKIPAAPGSTSPAPAASSSPSASSVSYSAPVQTDATYSGSGSFQSCVISRESGGSSQVMNGSGHYGLYQFSESTWEAYGGSASDFGNASVAEQNKVFDSAIAAGGESNWSAYDGC